LIKFAYIKTNKAIEIIEDQGIVLIKFEARNLGHDGVDMLCVEPIIIQSK